MNEYIIGNKASFGLCYSFHDDSHSTELKLFFNGNNILAFTHEGKHLSTRWNLDELVEWIREFVDNMREDPYPVNADGEFAAMKDETARDFDTDDDEEFDRYYDLIDEWVWRHNWHHASSGAILANVFFQQVGDQVEISWDNRICEAGVTFDFILGGEAVPKEEFKQVFNQFLSDYALHWFGN